MEVKFLKKEKNEIEVELEDLTLAEILRVYLNKDSNVDFVAWRREHPTDNPVLEVKTSSGTPQKAVDNAVKAITKDLDSFEKDISSLK